MKGETKEEKDTHALMKLLISPTVCVKFIRHTSLVPSARRICTLVVGSVWSTSKRVVRLARSAPPEGAADVPPVRMVPLVGNDPGMEAMFVLGLPRCSPGTGEPRRWPSPAKALYRGGM